MEKISDLTSKLKSIWGLQESNTCDNPQQDIIDSYNQSVGTLTGINCTKCNNRGDFRKLKNGYETTLECECMRERRNADRLNRSGLAKLVEQYTFDSFIASENWQKSMVECAKKTIADRQVWMFVGGGVGSGKTHICTATTSELIKQGLNARYMLWRDDGRRLKANVNELGYDDIIKKFKEIDVLYIDDLFKTEQGKTATQADYNLAYELINYRYNNKLKTIISCEKTLDEIVKLDEAIGSRIYEMARGCCINLSKDAGKNQRMRK